MAEEEKDDGTAQKAEGTEGSPGEKPRPADPSEMDRFIRQGIRDTFSGVRVFLRIVSGIVFLALVALYVSSGLHSVSPNEVGILERLGRLEGSPLNPGFHLTLPWPFDRVTKIPVKTVRKLSIECFYLPREGGEKRGAERESEKDEIDTKKYLYILTGDNNIISLEATILYTVVNPADYLFRIADPGRREILEGSGDCERLIRGLCTTALVHTLGGMKVDWALTGGKREIEEKVRSQLLSRIEALQCGIGVTFVELKAVEPPPLITANFNDVVKAKIDGRKYINEAESYRNETLTLAEALADGWIQAAHSYRNECREKSSGETERFLKQLKEYRGAEEITRYRLYLDFMTAITPLVSHKLIICKDGKRDVARVRIRIGEKGD